MIDVVYIYGNSEVAKARIAEMMEGGLRVLPCWNEGYQTLESMRGLLSILDTSEGLWVDVPEGHESLNTRRLVTRASQLGMRLMGFVQEGEEVGTMIKGLLTTVEANQK